MKQGWQKCRRRKRNESKQGYIIFLIVWVKISLAVLVGSACWRAFFPGSELTEGMPKNHIVTVGQMHTIIFGWLVYVFKKYWSLKRDNPLSCYVDLSWSVVGNLYKCFAPKIVSILSRFYQSGHVQNASGQKRFPSGWWSPSDQCRVSVYHWWKLCCRFVCC